MSSRTTLIALVATTVFIAMVPLFGNDGQTLPSPYYLDDDVQYFPAGPDLKLPPEEYAASSINASSKKVTVKSTLGELLFSNVVSVRFSGPETSKLSSSYQTLDNAGSTSISIFERYISVESTEKNGETIRTLYAYETISQIKQKVTTSQPAWPVPLPKRD